MKIIGFNIEKVSAERKKLTDNKLKINSNIEIKDISKSQIDLIKDKDTVNIHFEFKIDYEPGYANILLKGIVTCIFEKEDLKELMKMWKKKNIPEKSRLHLFNVILAKCSLRSLQLEEELGLPFHIPLPQIRPNQNTSYTG